LVSATLLTLVVLPVLFYVIETRARRAKAATAALQPA
jgi:hypothetical protein